MKQFLNKQLCIFKPGEVILEKYFSPNILNHSYNQYTTLISVLDKSIKKVKDKDIFIEQSKKQINQTQNNEQQGFITMLLNIEETLGENGIQYLSRVQEHLEKLKIEYPNLKKLLNIMFNQNNDEPIAQKNNQGQKQLEVDELEGLRNQNKTLKLKKMRLQQKFGEAIKKINELEILYKEQQQKNQSNEKQIEENNCEIINKNNEIKNLKQNIEEFQTQVKKKDEIFQQTLEEAKKISAHALQEIAQKLEIRHDQIIQVEKIHSDQLQQINEKEKGIKEENSELNQTIDEYLLMFKQNPQSQELERKIHSIFQRCQNLNDLIQNAKVQLENFIDLIKQPWRGLPNKNELDLKQVLKKNLELMQLYQKVFDNFQKTIAVILENSCKYHSNNAILKVKKNNSNIFIYLQNDNQSNKHYKQLYANIKTQHNDTTLLKDNQLQTIKDKIFDFKEKLDGSCSRSKSTIKIKKRQKSLTESKQSIHRDSQSKPYIDQNN
ncbi:unnamed protein product [Paramecium sonneborni]|uniref:Uncharacterized protein n=1 Tax=Paramecium sonneborni TaxID=65129 RepID=A0A8S1RN05_9CILI|nr:unnamed protein product [Paramecium sonneborni]